MSGRLRGFEAALVFHHESRHLSDRAKREPVDWNMVGARVERRLQVGRAALDARVDVRSVIQQSLVDYDWEFDGGLRGRYPLTSRVALVGAGAVRRIAVDGSRDRDDQTGARIEGGVRVDGPWCRRRVIRGGRAAYRSLPAGEQRRAVGERRVSGDESLRGGAKLGTLKPSCAESVARSRSETAAPSALCGAPSHCLINGDLCRPFIPRRDRVYRSSVLARFCWPRW